MEQGADRRTSSRFDKVFPVYLANDEGLARGIARNISEGGLFVETRETYPLGSRIRVTFADDESRSELTVLAEVRYQCFLNYAGPPGRNAVRGMGLRFVEFESDTVSPGIYGADAVMH